jgi:nicotinamidase/pyrazinamidase
MKPALILTDMVEDFISDDGPLPVGEEGHKIIPRLQELIAVCRMGAIPIIFANDALSPDDFLFKSMMKPHGIRGSSGVKIIDALKTEPSDLVVHKRRFSAFFKTDLDITLYEWGIDTIIVGGVATEICVLATAYDSVCHGFKTIVLSDCCASRRKKTHENVMDILKISPLRPLLKVMLFADFCRDVLLITSIK